MSQSWTNNEQFMNKWWTIYEQVKIIKSLASHEQDKTVESWASHELAMIKPCACHEKAMHKSWTSHTQVMKSWTRHEHVTSHEQGM